MVSRIWKHLNIIRSLPAIICFYLSRQKRIIEKDIKVWADRIGFSRENSPIWLDLHWLLLYKEEFRNVFYYRVRKSSRILPLILKLFYRPINSLYITTRDIKEGLYILHGFSTIISAKKIGKNCSINQQVTIGFNGDKNPTIGDNVTITAGAIVIGGITIGSNSVIGAGSVIVKDVPENSVVVENPARIVKLNGKKVDIPLNEYWKNPDKYQKDTLQTVI